MKKLSITRPARIQILEMLSDGAELGIDLTSEAMGDKCASLAFGQWLQDRFQVPVTFIETASGRTPFMLSDYNLGPMLRTKIVEGTEHDYLDCLKSGLVDTMWVMNAYNNSQGRYGKLFIPPPPERTDEIIVIPLSKTPYDQRREMDLGYVADFVSIMSDNYNNVTVLYDKPSSYFPNAEHLEMKDFVRRIASARLVIAGDTGASHLAAVVGTPLVTLYPDWVRYGLRKMTDTIACTEWWEIQSYFTPYNTFPNAPYEKMRLSILPEDRRFAIGHVMQCVKELVGLN